MNIITERSVTVIDKKKIAQNNILIKTNVKVIDKTILKLK
jgi:hypothetical protein